MEWRDDCLLLSCADTIDDFFDGKEEARKEGEMQGETNKSAERKTAKMKIQGILMMGPKGGGGGKKIGNRRRKRDELEKKEGIGDERGGDKGHVIWLRMCQQQRSH
jgi:hypothetical protein